MACSEHWEYVHYLLQAKVCGSYKLSRTSPVYSISAVPIYY